MKAKFLIPFGLFVILAGFLGFGLNLNPREIPSPLIDKPAPAFRLARLDQPEQKFSLEDMKGQIWLLNVWASWCVSCRQEHPALIKLAEQKIMPVVGLNYKEVRGDNSLDAKKMDASTEQALVIQRAQGWLKSHGDPYTLSVLDMDGRVGIDFGVYGVPETFLIDGAGRIRYKLIGILTPEVLEKDILPRIAKLREGAKGEK